MAYAPINADKARQLRSTGMAWTAIATILSYEARRYPPFQPYAVQRAVYDYYGTSRVPSRKRAGAPV